jgi:YfiH family protein
MCYTLGIVERSDTLRRQNAGELVTYEFESMAVDGLVHAVFTRLGGVSRGPFATLNVGSNVGDDEAALAENHARIYAHLGTRGDRVASARQVHGSRVAEVNAAGGGQVQPNTDGLVTRTPGIGLLLRFADCQPVLLYDPENHALGLVHAGWRGVAQGIARRAVDAMQKAFGSRSEALLAGLGPAIGPCHYTVGKEVAAVMAYALPDWQEAMIPDGDGWRLNLSSANAQQLAAAGVRQIEQAHVCTACRSDEFFSHRADDGRTGRFATVAYLRQRDGEGGQQVAGKDVQGPGLGDEANVPAPHPPGLPGFQELLEGRS